MRASHSGCQRNPEHVLKMLSQMRTLCQHLRLPTNLCKCPAAMQRAPSESKRPVLQPQPLQIQRTPCMNGITGKAPTGTSKVDSFIRTLNMLSANTRFCYLQDACIEFSHSSHSSVEFFRLSCKCFEDHFTSLPRKGTQIVDHSDVLCEASCRP